MTELRTGLSFHTLRAANIKRLPLFRDARGNICHSHPTGGDWSVSDWVEAVVGELGEFANLHKKVRRGDLTLEDAKLELGRELADIVIYLDILALQLDIDLDAAVVEKFNAVSRRVSAKVFIGDDDDWQEEDPARQSAASDRDSLDRGASTEMAALAIVRKAIAAYDASLLGRLVDREARRTL